MSRDDEGARRAATSAAPPRAVFRLPRSAYLPVLFLVFCVSVLARQAWLLPIYLIPIAAAVFVARRSTTIDSDGVTVRALLGSRRLRWDDVLGLVVDERGAVAASLRSGTILRLPYVRMSHLPVLHQLTSGRVPTIERADDSAG